MSKITQYPQRARCQAWLPRPPVAVKGAWLSENEFGFTYNEFATAQNTIARAVFQGDGISLSVKDPFNDLDMIIAGRTGK